LGGGAGAGFGAASALAGGGFCTGAACVPGITMLGMEGAAIGVTTPPREALYRNLFMYSRYTVDLVVISPPELFAFKSTCFERLTLVTVTGGEGGPVGASCCVLKSVLKLLLI
jgi:hypothetical protein